MRRRFDRTAPGAARRGNRRAGYLCRRDRAGANPVRGSGPPKSVVRRVGRRRPAAGRPWAIRRRRGVRVPAPSRRRGDPRYAGRGPQGAAARRRLLLLRSQLQEADRALRGMRSRHVRPLPQPGRTRARSSRARRARRAGRFLPAGDRLCRLFPRPARMACARYAALACAGAWRAGRLGAKGSADALLRIVLQPAGARFLGRSRVTHAFARHSDRNARTFPFAGGCGLVRDTRLSIGRTVRSGAPASGGGPHRRGGTTLALGTELPCSRRDEGTLACRGSADRARSFCLALASLGARQPRLVSPRRALESDTWDRRGSGRGYRRRGGAAMVARTSGSELLFPPWSEACAGLARCARALAGPHAMERCGSGGSALSLGFALASSGFRQPWVRPGHFYERDVEPDAWQWLRFVGERGNQPLFRPPIALVLGTGSLVLGDSPARNFAFCPGLRPCRGRPRAFLPGARAAWSRALGVSRFALALLVLSATQKRQYVRFSSRSFHVAAVFVGLRGIRLRTTLGKRTWSPGSGRGARREGIGGSRGLRHRGCLGFEQRRGFPARPLVSCCARGCGRCAFLFRREGRASIFQRRLRVHGSLPAIRGRNRRCAPRSVYAARLFLLPAFQSRALEFSVLDSCAAGVSPAFSLARGDCRAAALSHALPH